MHYFCYILKAEKGRYYVGSTHNVVERLAMHNTGRMKSTKAYVPWKMIYSEAFATLAEARKRERQVKGWKSRLAIERLTQTASSSNG